MRNSGQAGEPGPLHDSDERASMGAVRPTPPPTGTCIYCGLPTRGIACIAHSDLPRNDPSIGLMTVRRTIIESWFGL